MKDSSWAASQIRNLLLSDHRVITTEEMQLIEKIIQEAIWEAEENVWEECRQAAYDW